MKILARPEWTDEQRAFLQADPELAKKIEMYLNYLDKKIETLEEIRDFLN